MLKSIFIVTTIVRNLTTVETAYTEHLLYQSVERGHIGIQLAETWDAPAMAGKPFVLMQPASGSEVFLRFIEDAAVRTAPPALTTHGWAATELLVTDPDELARRLEGSAFTVIGPPQDLYPSPTAPRAMQVSGPDGEVLYMTRPIPGGSRYDLGVASSFVDRTFIVVVGGPSLDELRRFYRETLGLAVGDPMPFTIGVLSRANSLPPDTPFPLAMAPLSPGHLIELDQYPAATAPRPVAQGHLPPRMAMVTFLADALDGASLRWRSPPRAIASPPYSGRRVGVTLGPAGEWIEIAEHRAL
jgi:catechol 2,3-dioxygenase-like lactoylglutathione lyase family enzyme